MKRTHILVTARVTNLASGGHTWEAKVVRVSSIELVEPFNAAYETDIRAEILLNKSAQHGTEKTLKVKETVKEIYAMIEGKDKGEQA